MEWKNYNELAQDYHEMGNRYLMQLDEKLDYHEYNQENAQDYKKYIYNENLEDAQDRNEKINYYFLLNNLGDLNNDEQNYNFKYDLMRPSLNTQNIVDNNLETPFINEGKSNNLFSDENNNENKDQNKRNLFKIQSFNKLDGESNQNCQKNKELINDENGDFINNYQNMPLKERMKIKKQKTKKLLENKTHRMNTQEESKENNIEKNSLSNNTQENISASTSHNNSLNNNNLSFNYSLNPDMISKMNKKEIKMLRNRLSAQRSRDRKKKELSDLKAITKSLFQENEKLRNEIKERDSKINELINLLCPKCQEKFKKNNMEITVKGDFEQINEVENNEMSLTPGKIIAGKKKLALLMTGLFTIFCIFGSFMAPNDANILRHLKEKNRLDNKNVDFNDEKRVNVPFLIEKDYTIRHKKEIEMYKKIQQNNLKNKNLMVPASVFKNNSEQIISNINNSINNSPNHNNLNDNNKNKTDDKIKETIHNFHKNNNNTRIEAKNSREKDGKELKEKKMIEDN